MQIKVKSDHEVMAKHLAESEVAFHYLKRTLEADDVREFELAMKDVIEHNPRAFAEWLRGMLMAERKLDLVRAALSNDILKRVSTPKIGKAVVRGIRVSSSRTSSKSTPASRRTVVPA